MTTAPPPLPGSVLRVALTGGIGSGKTAVSQRFEALGVPVLDADIIARELVAAGTDALQDISACFGAEILTATGELDRARLRALVFSDPLQRRRLEDILHPRIRACMEQRAAASLGPYVIMVIPLLLETGRQRDFHRVLVVDTQESLQVARAARRDGADEADIRRIMAQQADRVARLQAADDLICNTTTLAALDQQVQALHQCYLHLARGVATTPQVVKECH